MLDIIFSIQDYSIVKLSGKIERTHRKYISLHLDFTLRVIKGDMWGVGRFSRIFGLWWEKGSKNDCRCFLLLSFASMERSFGKYMKKRQKRLQILKTIRIRDKQSNYKIAFNSNTNVFYIFNSQYNH